MSTRTTSRSKPRRLPQRTCVACRRTGEQASFVRLVRIAADTGATVEVDDGKRHVPGRGAYLCREASCWERGLRGALAGNLRVTLTEHNREALRDYAARFAATDEMPETGDRGGENA
jgi:predicted RNA-binding protein YlxR (DUF448 family)